ncbi:MAG: DUF2282 domain-containing protein [Rhodospirillales bacterium]|nr:DUF2282 domain-containing protein [Rhodospirillales bacterium]
MNTTSALIASAMLAAFAMTAGGAMAQDAKKEKCYGIVKAGKNDCQTATSSCAGTSKKDLQADAWVYLPAGTCAKIAGGSSQPVKG